MIYSETNYSKILFLGTRSELSLSGLKDQKVRVEYMKEEITEAEIMTWFMKNYH